MTPDDADLREDDFTALLAAYDEALAAGLPFTPGPETPSSGDLLAQLDRVRGCLHRLEQKWPRSARPRDLPTPSLAGSLPPPADGAGRFGRFQVVRELGRGGFGVVFLAVEPALRRPVALKVPRPEILMVPELRRRFLRE